MYEVYMTDGSGIDHREYRLLRPTVWAKPPGLSAFVILTGNSHGLENNRRRAI